MTKSRQATLDVLSIAQEPVSASSIVENLGSLCDQATVYRTLHYLEENGLAESFVLHCREHGTERYYTARGTKHRHWFHCEACHGFTDLGACTLDALVKDIEQNRGLEVNSHVLYFTGLCQTCRGQLPAQNIPLEK